MKTRRFISILLLSISLLSIPQVAFADAPVEKTNEYNFTVWAKVKYKRLRGHSKSKHYSFYFDFDNEIAVLFYEEIPRNNTTKPIIYDYSIYKITRDSNNIIKLFGTDGEEHHWKWKLKTERLFFGITLSSVDPCDSEGNKIDSDTYDFTSGEVKRTTYLRFNSYWFLLGLSVA